MKKVDRRERPDLVAQDAHREALEVKQLRKLGTTHNELSHNVFSFQMRRVKRWRLELRNDLCVSPHTPSLRQPSLEGIRTSKALKTLYVVRGRLCVTNTYNEQSKTDNVFFTQFSSREEYRVSGEVCVFELRSQNVNPSVARIS
jgi:hypothetical protein